MSIHPFPGPPGRGPVDSGGEPPDDGRMDARVAKLETIAEKTAERLSTLERDVAVIRSNYATKADVTDSTNKIIMWVVGAIFLAQLLPILKDFIKPPAPQAPAAATQPAVTQTK